MEKDKRKALRTKHIINYSLLFQNCQLPQDKLKPGISCEALFECG